MKKVISIVTALSVLGSCSYVFATTEDELKAKLDKNNDAIEAKTSEINQVKKQQKTLLDEIEELDAEMNKAQKELDDIQSQINSLNSDIKNKQKSIEEANKKQEEEEILLQKRVRAMYENGDVTYVKMLMDSSSVSDFIKRCELTDRMVEADKELFNSLTELKNQINKEVAELEESKVVVEAAKRVESENKQKLATSRSAKDSRAKLLEKDVAELQKQLDRELEESQAIERQLRELSGTSTVVSKNEDFIWPGAYSKVITCKYGPRIHPITKKNSTHTGIDIRAALGTSVYAAASGTVIKACYNTAYGNMIIIDHGNGLSTLYGHATQLLVKVGDTVNQGDTIMKAGSTGYSTGPHLHFEVRKNGTPQDPKNYLDYTGVTFK